MFDRSTAPPDDAPFLVRLIAWLGLGAEPRLRAPPVPRLARIRRGLVPAVRQARGAVAARVGLADYLRARLARYDAALPVPRSCLPLRVELLGDQIRSTLVASGERPEGAPPDPAAALELLGGPSAIREWTEVRARLAALDEEASAARLRAEALAERLSADVASGALAPAPAPEGEVPATSLGRPRVRGLGLLWTMTLVAGAMVLAEAWAIAVPLLLLAGAYPPPDSWLGPGAIDSLVLLAFAVGAALGLLGLAFAALRAADDLMRDAGPRGQRRLRKVAALFAFAAASSAAGATALGAPRSGLPPASHALLLLALPAGAALATRRAQREHTARAQELAAALAWDRERAAALADRARRLEQLAWAEWDARAAQRRLTRARARLATLARRADHAAHLLERATRRTRRAELRLAQSLLAALERDRYEYLREASARRSAGDAVARPPAEKRPAAPERVASGRVAV